MKYEVRGEHAKDVISVIKYPSHYCIYANDIESFRTTSVKEVCDELVKEMTGLYAAMSISPEISLILYDMSDELNATVISNGNIFEENCVTVFLSEEFSGLDIVNILTGLNENTPNRSSLTKEKIDDEYYEGPDYIKGVKN